MLRFSQRRGYQPASKPLQKESIDDDLRTRIWNVLVQVVWDMEAKAPRRERHYYAKEVTKLIAAIWMYHFVLPIGSMPDLDYGTESAIACIEKRFLTMDWAGVYDFVEFVIERLPDFWCRLVQEHLNDALGAENSAYRVVGHQIVAITDDIEMDAVEAGLRDGTASSRAHLARALALLAERNGGDCANSIKESISAVEAMARWILDQPHASLGDCLGPLQCKGYLPPAYRTALGRLFGYTSNEGGVRHALQENGVEPSYAQAKFMLVTCSAYVNYLVTRAAELGRRDP